MNIWEEVNKDKYREILKTGKNYDGKVAKYLCKILLCKFFGSSFPSLFFAFPTERKHEEERKNSKGTRKKE